jgi:hypothetical protein
MKKLMLGLALSAFAAMATPSFAQTSYYYTDLHVVLDETEVIEGVQTAERNEPLLEATARFPRAVILKEETSLGAAANLVKIPADTLMFGRYDDTVWTYCVLANLEAGGQALNAIVGGIFTAGLNLLDGSYKGAALNCLQDTDNDGDFDQGWGNNVAEESNPLIAYDLFKKKLDSSPKYERTSTENSPTVPVEIHWSKPKSGNISVWIEAAGLRTRKQSVAMPSPGEAPGKAKLWGAEIDIISYDSETKALTYRIVKAPPRQYVRIDATKTITTTTTYVYY